MIRQLKNNENGRIFAERKKEQVENTTSEFCCLGEQEIK